MEQRPGIPPEQPDVANELAAENVVTVSPEVWNAVVAEIQNWPYTTVAYIKSATFLDPNIRAEGLTQQEAEAILEGLQERGLVAKEVTKVSGLSEPSGYAVLSGAELPSGPETLRRRLGRTVLAPLGEQLSEWVAAKGRDAQNVSNAIGKTVGVFTGANRKRTRTERILAAREQARTDADREQAWQRERKWQLEVRPDEQPPVYDYHYLETLPDDTTAEEPQAQEETEQATAPQMSTARRMRQVQRAAKARQEIQKPRRRL